MYDIAIIGGGAAGLMAAVSAKMTDAARTVVILERLDKVGKKLLATGNGRCNLTHDPIREDCYHGGISLFREVYGRFPAEETRRFFERLGVWTFADEAGRVYPVSCQASAVLDALRFRAEALGAEGKPSFPVTEIRKEKGRFCIISPDETVSAARVIVCAGGKASPSLGSDGSGYALLRRFGHTDTPLAPAIVQIKTDTSPIRALKGIKVNAEAAVLLNGKPLRREKGEVLFTEYGLSGPPILQLSRIASTEKGPLAVRLNFLPELAQDELYRRLCIRKKELFYLTLENFLSGILQKRLGQTLLKYAGVLPLGRSAGTLTDQELRTLARAIQCFSLEVRGTLSFSGAQVTAGGIRCGEFTGLLESKKQPGLFAAGEILDIDGDCGGYNLQWAWSSGFTAGKAAAESLLRGSI